MTTEETSSAIVAANLVALERRLDGFIAWIRESNAAADLRHQQRFDAQQQAVKDALSAQEKATNSALTAAKEAVTKAETASEKRFDSINEFRGQLRDQAATLLTRTEADARLEALTERIDALATRQMETERRVASDASNAIGKTAGLSQGWAILLGLVSLAAGAASLFALFGR